MISMFASNQHHAIQQPRLHDNNINWGNGIDTDNLQVIASKEYLHNYTYLQYCMFPQLFQYYISQLNQHQLVDTLNSYIGTFMEFFVDGVYYDTAYDLNLLTLGGNSQHTQNLIQLKDRLKSIATELTLINKSHQIQRQSIPQQINCIYQALNQTISSIQSLQININYLHDQKANVEYKQQQQMLKTIIQDIKTKKQLTRSLFELICRLVSKILQFQQSCLETIIKCPMPKYLLHSIIMELQNQNKTKIKKLKQNRTFQQLDKIDNGNFKCLKQELWGVLRQRMKLKIVPIYVQIYGLYVAIRNGRTKTIDLTGWSYSIIINKMQLIIELEHVLRLLSVNYRGNDKLNSARNKINKINVKQLQNRIEQEQDDLLQQQKQVQNTQNSEQDKQYRLTEMVQTVSECVGLLINGDTVGEGKQLQQLSVNNSRQYKQLTAESVEKICRQFVSLFIDTEGQRQQHSGKQNDNHCQIEAVQKRYIGQRGQRMQEKENQQKQQEEKGMGFQQRDILKSLPERFLVGYNKLLNCLQIGCQDESDINSTTNINVNVNGDDDNTVNMNIEADAIDNATIEGIQLQGKQQDQQMKYQHQLIVMNQQPIDNTTTTKNVDRNINSRKFIKRDNKAEVNQSMLQLLNGLTGDLNQQLRQLLAFKDINNKLFNDQQTYLLNEQDSVDIVSGLRKRVHILQVQTQLAVQAISSYNINYNNKSQETHQHQLRKVANSLYVNLITLKLFHNTLLGNDCSQRSQQEKQQQKYGEGQINILIEQKHQQGKKHQKLQQQQQHQNQFYKNSSSLKIRQIQQLFDQVFQLGSALDHNQSSFSTNNKDSRRIINSHPSLQNVLYMYSAIQLWLSLSTPSLTAVRQAQQFLSSVINKYSQENISIPQSQIVYVRYIIEMYEIYNLFLIDIPQKDGNIEVRKQYQQQKIIHKLKKMLSICGQLNQCGRVRLQQLINIPECLDRYILILVPYLVASTMTKSERQQQQLWPKDQAKQKKRQGQRAKSINQINHNCLIEFNRMLQMVSDNGYTEQQLSHGNLLNYFSEQLLTQLSGLRQFSESAAERKMENIIERQQTPITLVNLDQQQLQTKKTSTKAQNLKKAQENKTLSTIKKNDDNSYEGQKQLQQKELSLSFVSEDNKVMYGLILSLYNKNKTIIKLKRQLKLQGKNVINLQTTKSQLQSKHQCKLQGVCDSIYQNSVDFLVQTALSIAESKLAFTHAHQQFSSMLEHTKGSGSSSIEIIEKVNQQGLANDKVRQLGMSMSGSSKCHQLLLVYIHQLEELKQLLNDRSRRVVKHIGSHLFRWKLMLYKLSPLQIQFLTKDPQKEAISEESRNNVLKNIKQVLVVVDGLVRFGVMVRSYLEWMLLETQLKLECIARLLRCNSYINDESIIKEGYNNGHRNKSKDNNKEQQQPESSSFHLLRALTLMSHLSSTNINISSATTTVSEKIATNIASSRKFTINYEYLEGVLSSNVQQNKEEQQPSQSIVDLLELSRLQLNEATIEELQHVMSYECLEFIYEYVRFDVHNEQQELVLFNLFRKISTCENKHLYLSAQKLQKLHLVSLIDYLHSQQTTSLPNQ